MRRAVLISALFALVSPDARAAEPWAVARSPRFEVTSDAGPQLASDAARRLERLQDVLERLLPAAMAGEGPRTPVLLVRDRSLFESLVPSGRRHAGELAGFFESGGDGPCIVAWLEGAGPGADDWRTLDHELAHLHLDRALPAQPVWVGEGLAQALSGAQLGGGSALLAAAAPPRDGERGAGPELSLAEIVAVDWDSPVYLGNGSTLAFYAGSLALVRRLLHGQGLPALLAMLQRLAKGVAAADAFAGTYGPPQALEATLFETPPGPLLSVSTTTAVPAVDATGASDAHVERLLGDVLLHGGHGREAQRRYEAALRSDSGEPAARAGLAQLLLQKGRWREARAELQLARLARPRDPDLLLRHAQLLLSEGRNRPEGLTPDVEAEAVSALEQAVALAPDLGDAVELLARERPEPLAQRTRLLERVFSRDPGRPDLGLTLSALYLKRNDVDAARRVLRRSRDAAREETYRFLCDRSLSQIGRYAAETAEARGRLVRVDCQRDGSLRFTVATDRGRLPLEAASRRAFFAGGGEGDELELLCGPQDLAVRARYQPASQLGRPGVLLSLDLAPADGP